MAGDRAISPETGQARNAARIADRHALERMIPLVRTGNAALPQATRLKVAVAVCAIRGLNGADIDLVRRTGWAGTRMENRYIQCWIRQHRDHDADRLTTALAEAVDHARAEDRGLILPDLAPEPITYQWADAADG